MSEKTNEGRYQIVATNAGAHYHSHVMMLIDTYTGRTWVFYPEKGTWQPVPFSEDASPAPSN